MPKVLAANMERKRLGIIKEILGRSEGEYMTRFHLTPWGWWPFRRRWYLHVYDNHDNDPHPHDHPFGFRSIILLGGYTERVYRYEVTADGVRTPTNRHEDHWYDVRRWPLTTHAVPATHVHRIMKLHGRRTVTLLLRGGKEQDWGFFVHTFEKGVVKVPGWEYIGLPEPDQPAY